MVMNDDAFPFFFPPSLPKLRIYKPFFNKPEVQINDFKLK